MDYEINYIEKQNSYQRKQSPCIALQLGGLRTSCFLLLFLVPLYKGGTKGGFNSKLHSLGWQHKIEIGAGISKIYEWYKSQIEND